MQFTFVIEDHDLDAIMPALALSQAVLQRAAAKINTQAQEQMRAFQLAPSPDKFDPAKAAEGSNVVEFPPVGGGDAPSDA